MWKKLLTGWIDVRKGERATAFSMGLFFFLTTATFWAMKPMKRSLLISYHKEHPLELLGAHLGGAQAEQLAKVVNVLAALLLAIIFSQLSRRLEPRYIVAVFCAILVVAFLVFANLLGSGGAVTIWSFYTFGDMFNTLMVTLFWALMHDSIEAHAAKRLYGVVGLGGLTGGLVGATLVRSSVATLGRENVLLLCIVPTVLIGIIGFFYARHNESRRAKFVQRDRRSQPVTTAEISNVRDRSLFGGLWRLASSKYLLAICLLVAFYEIASSIVDFQLGAMVERYVSDSLERDRYFGLIAQAQGVLSILVQLFLTGFVMKRFGVGAALLVLPFAILCGSLGFLLLPTLPFAALMAVSDNSMNYSINQSAKEALYVPTMVEDKYEAKAFIDMFVQRLAKVVAVGLNLGLVAYVSMEQVRWLSVASILVLALWIGVIRFAGRHFEHLAGAGESGDVKAEPARTSPREVISPSQSEIAA